jgi:hypothetical protein
LLLLGGLLVSGYFNKWLKPLFSPTHPAKKWNEVVAKQPVKTKPAQKAPLAKKSTKK